jgi:TP901 family phage tail tape measure protein
MVALASAFVRLRPDANKAEFVKAGRDMGNEAGRAAGGGFTGGFGKDAAGPLRNAKGQFVKAGEDAGRGAGDSYGRGFTRGSDGRLRDSRGKFVSDSAAAGGKAGTRAGDGFASSFGKSGGKIKQKLGENLKLAAGVFVPLGIGAAVAEIGKIGIAYEDNLNIFKTVSGATGDQMAAVANKARALGADVKLPGVSAAGAASAMTELAKAGFSVQQSMDAAQGTLQLARVANINEADAAEIASNAVNAFGIQAKDTSFVVDELAGAANSSSIEIGDASNAFKQAASVFSGLQGPAVGGKEAITELNTAIAILGNNGTSLKQMMLQLTGPSTRTKNLMHLLATEAAGANISLADQHTLLNGNSKDFYAVANSLDKANPKLANIGDIAYDANGKMRSLPQIIGLITKATQGWTQEDKNAAVTQIFGSDATRSVLALMKGGLPVYEKQRRAVMEQGAAAKFAAAKNAGLGGAIDNVKSQFENAAISIYTAVKGPLTTGLNAVAAALPGIFAGIGQFASFIGRNIGVIRDWALAIGAVTLALRINSAMLAIQAAGGLLAYIRSGSLVTSVTKAWAAGQELLNITMEANPIGLVIVAITALVAGFILAYKHSATFRAIVQGAWSGIKAVVGAVVGWITGTIVPSLIDAWHGIEAAGLWLWHNVFVPVWNGIMAVVNFAVAAVKGYIALVKFEYQLLASAGLWLWHNIFIPVWDGIKAVVNVAVSIVKGYIALLEAEFRILASVGLWLWHNIIEPVWGGIRKVIEIAWLAIRIILMAAYNMIRNTLAPIFSWLWQNVMIPVWKGVTGTISAAWANITAIFVAIRNYLSGYFRATWNIAKSVVTSIWNAIKGAISTAWAGIVAVFTAIKNYLEGVFRSAWNGAKNVVVGVFNYLRSIISVWWNTYVKPVFGAVKSGWDNLAAGFSNIYNGKIKPLFSAFVGFIKNTVVGGFKAGVDAIKAAWDKVQEYARKPVAFVVHSVINPFIRGLNAAAKVVGVKDHVDEIPGFRAGGQLPLVGHASGGKISGAGGISDNRQALIPGLGAVQLQGGEYVVNRQATAQALPLLKWVNSGMEGGPSKIASYLGRPVADMPGDGSEGFAFKKGGLIGWAEDVWDSVTHPLDTIKRPFEAAMNKIPGVGVIKDFLIGSGKKLLDGAVGWITKLAGGGGKVGDAISFLHRADGHPYGWAQAGPDSWDCSGIVSSVYNVLHGKNPYAHTFSTESASPFFPKDGPGGPLTAAWSHPGEAPASASVGHMMGRVGNLTFESTGSRGVHLGSTTRSINDFANIGHYRQGGLFGAPIKLFDSGGLWPSGTLGANLSGHPEQVLTGGAGGDVGAIIDRLDALIALARTNPAGVADALQSPIRKGVTRARTSGLGARYT